MRYSFLSVVFVLAGCALVSPISVEYPITPLRSPPNVGPAITRESIIEYHKSITHYIQYLVSEQRYIEDVYDLPKMSRKGGCYHFPLDEIILPQVPDVARLSNEELAGALLEHISHLRELLYIKNGTVRQHNANMEKILEKCVVVNY